MPQVFQVLRCYKCLVFQVHQTKKSSKFQCKLCGEKQSIKRHYGIGTAKDCRLHVQKLNGIRGEIDELKESIESDSEEENKPVNLAKPDVESTETRKSKWSDYIDHKEEQLELKTESETEMVLEMPKKRKRVNFKCPRTQTGTDFVNDSYSIPSTRTSYLNSNVTCNYKNKDNTVICDQSIRIETSAVIDKIISSPSTKNKKDMTIISSKVSVNSKWAQFVEEEENSFDYENARHFINAQDSNENKDYVNNDCNNGMNNSEQLFTLCDDSDLDNVLDI